MAVMAKKTIASIDIKAYSLTGGFEQFFASSGDLPQKLQDSPSLFKNGLWLAHVPANFPSFFAHILMAIPANAKANNIIVINKSFITLILWYKITI